MVAYCNNCQRYVNQACERCGATYGIDKCEWYACGGRMVCPNCGGSNLSAKRKFTADPYDFSKQEDRAPSMPGRQTELEKKYFAEQKIKEEMLRKSGDRETGAERTCALCGFKLDETWKFCPECGVSLIKK